MLKHSCNCFDDIDYFEEIKSLKNNICDCHHEDPNFTDMSCCLLLNPPKKVIQHVNEYDYYRKQSCLSQLSHQESNPEKQKLNQLNYKLNVKNKGLGNYHSHSSMHILNLSSSTLKRNNYKRNWHNQSDRKIASVVPRSRNIGIDIKHNSYQRYLNKLRGNMKVCPNVCLKRGGYFNNIEKNIVKHV